MPWARGSSMSQTALAATLVSAKFTPRSFRAMNGSRPLRYRRKSAGGALERIALLRAHGIELTEIGPSASAPLDDILDAVAAAWSAHRVATRAALSLPDEPEDLDGYSIAIWY
jgi:predicted RNase H-like nuclease